VTQITQCLALTYNSPPAGAACRFGHSISRFLIGFFSYRAWYCSSTWDYRLPSLHRVAASQVFEK
jgi:hypothetical protein